MRELRDYMEPEGHGSSDKEVVHRVMCKALDYQCQLSELKAKEPRRWKQPRR